MVHGAASRSWRVTPATSGSWLLALGVPGRRTIHSETTGSDLVCEIPMAAEGAVVGDATRAQVRRITLMSANSAAEHQGSSIDFIHDNLQPITSHHPIEAII